MTKCVPGLTSIWSGRLAALAILALGGIVAFFLQTGLSTANQGLTVDTSELALGEIWETDHFPWAFTVRNSSTSDLEILDFQSSCNCVTITPKRNRSHDGIA